MRWYQPALGDRGAVHCATARIPKGRLAGKHQPAGSCIWPTKEAETTAGQELGDRVLGIGNGICRKAVGCDPFPAITFLRLTVFDNALPLLGAEKQRQAIGLPSKMQDVG